MKNYYSSSLTPFNAIFVTIVLIVLIYSMIQLFSPSKAMSAFNDFPLHGVRLSFLKDFIEEIGGREKLKDYTTYQVCEKFVKAATVNSQMSYCDLLRSKGHRGFGSKAKVFVSHAWQYRFVEVVDALYDHFEKEVDKDEIVLWFDVFSVNQHDLSSKDFDWWSDTLKSAIEEIGYTVMVLTPWNDPLPLKRGWCILELYCTSVTGSKFEAAMSHKEKAAFLYTLLEEKSTKPFQKMLATIDSEKSECSNKKDRSMIFEVARNVGFAQINGMVISQLREWVVSVVKEEIQKKKNANPESFEALFYTIILGKLYLQVGTYDRAERIFSQVLEELTASSRSEDKDTILAVLNTLAEIYNLTGKYSEAERLLTKALANELEIDEIAALRFKKTLSEAWYHDTQYTKALHLVEYCLNGWSRLRLKDDLLSLKATYANILTSIGKLERAEVVLLECYYESLNIFGENHRTTLRHLNDLASIYVNKKELTKAEPLLTQVKDQLVSRTGEYHPNSLFAKQNLAYLWMSQGKYEKAENLLCFEESLKVFGETHKIILILTKFIANFYIKQGKYEKAEKIYLDCVERRKESLGLHHIDTIKAKTHLVEYYCNQGLFSKAFPLYEEGMNQYLAMNDQPKAILSMLEGTILSCMDMEKSKILTPFENESRLKILDLLINFHTTAATTTTTTTPRL